MRKREKPLNDAGIPPTLFLRENIYHPFCYTMTSVFLKNHGTELNHTIKTVGLRGSMGLCHQWHKRRHTQKHSFHVTGIKTPQCYKMRVTLPWWRPQGFLGRWASKGLQLVSEWEGAGRETNLKMVTPDVDGCDPWHALWTEVAGKCLRGVLVCVFVFLFCAVRCRWVEFPVSTQCFSQTKSSTSKRESPVWSTCSLLFPFIAMHECCQNKLYSRTDYASEWAWGRRYILEVQFSMVSTSEHFVRPRTHRIPHELGEKYGCVVSSHRFQGSPFSTKDVWFHWIVLLYTFVQNLTFVGPGSPLVSYLRYLSPR